MCRPNQPSPLTPPNRTTTPSRFCPTWRPAPKTAEVDERPSIGESVCLARGLRHGLDNGRTASPSSEQGLVPFEVSGPGDTGVHHCQTVGVERTTHILIDLKALAEG